MNIFERMLAGGVIPNDDPQMPQAWEAFARTINLSVPLNASTNVNQTRAQVLKMIEGSK